MNMLNGFFLFSFIFLVSACSTKTKMVTTRMLSPEAQGKLWKGNADIRAQGVKKGNLTFENNSINNAIEDEGDTHEAGIAGEMGLWPKLDIYFQPSFLDSPTLVGLKAQLWGDNRLHAKRGNFSVSLLGSLGSHHANNVQTRSERDEYLAKFKKQHDREEAGLIAGYRLTENLLFYVSGMMFHEKIEGKVQTRSGLLNSRFRYTTYGEMYSAGAIYYFKKHYQMKVDYTQLSQEWNKSENESLGMVNGALGIIW